jgi:hypothetical protein
LDNSFVIFLSNELVSAVYVYKVKEIEQKPLFRLGTDVATKYNPTRR